MTSGPSSGVATADDGLAAGPGFDLQAGFETFVQAAKRLEHSYAVLKRRAEAIDSQLQEANAQLASALAEREAVFAALPVGVVSLDAANTPRVQNPEATRLLEVVADAGADLLGLPAGEHTVADCALRVVRVALPDEGSLLVVEDRSRVVSLEREVDRLDRLAGLSELALGIAHEIKNPLNGAMGFAALLERHEDPDAIRRCARNVATGMRQVDDIVRSMLAFARPREGQLVAGTVASIVEAAASEAGVPQSRLTVEGLVDESTDAPTLTRVLSNLFRNSFEAGASAVRVGVDGDDENLTLEVADDGPGVDADVGSRLFEPFVTTKASSSHRAAAGGGGHGLGLALVARILSFVGGSIELLEDGDARDAAVGARFRVSIPRLRRQGADVD